MKVSKNGKNTIVCPSEMVCGHYVQWLCLEVVSFICTMPLFHRVTLRNHTVHNDTQLERRTIPDLLTWCCRTTNYSVWRVLEFRAPVIPSAFLLPLSISWHKKEPNQVREPGKRTSTFGGRSHYWKPCELSIYGNSGLPFLKVTQKWKFPKMGKIP